MVKVKRIVHLQDKNIAEDDMAAAKPAAPVIKEEKVASDAGEGVSPNHAVNDGGDIKDEDGPEERRSTRKIKKKRHKYGEDEADDFLAGLSEVEDGSRAATPVRGANKVAKRLLQTPASNKKKFDAGVAEGNSATETPPGKRPRLARAATKYDYTPKKEEVPLALKKEAGSNMSSPPTTPGSAATPASADDSLVKKEVSPASGEEQLPPPPPPVPKETVTFRVDASNPTGFQNLIDFLIRVLRRKDQHGFFAHPPTETLCPGYFSRVQVRMDLDLIQQKFESGSYKDLSTFRADAMLLFDNAIKYFDSSSVLYHSARKLRQFVRKTTVKDGLLGLKFAFPTLMAGISISQLGLDEAELAAQKPTAADAAATTTPTKSTAATTTTPTGPYDDEGNMLVEIDRPEGLLADEDLKIEWIRMDKEDKSKSKTNAAAAAKSATTKQALRDNVIPREVLTTWINGVGAFGGRSGKRATSVTNPHISGPAEAAMTRRDTAQGLTSLAILNPDNAAVHVDPNGEALYKPPPSASRGAGGDNAAMSVAISMKQTLNRLTPGNSSSGNASAAIAGFKEDRRNLIKPVKAIEETPFCSFGPSYDSRFANLCKEDSDQLISSFHSEDDLTHAEDIRNAIGRALGGGGGRGDIDYELDAVDGLLDVFSGGEYRKRDDVVESRKQLLRVEEKIGSMGGSAAAAAPVGVEKERGPAVEWTTMDQLLSSSASRIESLHRMQMSRLSRPPPPHLALVRPPSTDELGLAEEVISSLTALAKKVTPEYLVSQRALFQVLGVDLEKGPNGEGEAPKREVSAAGKEIPTALNRLEAPTSPVAKCQVPQNIFQRNFNTGISFATS